MKLAAILASATVLGGGAVATAATNQLPGFTARPAAAGAVAANAKGGAAANGRPSFAQMAKVRGELRKRTLEELGLTPAEITAARTAAIESMVEDELLTQQQADAMIERMEAHTKCLEDADDPRECRPKRGAGRPGGGFGGPGRFGRGGPGAFGGGAADGGDAGDAAPTGDDAPPADDAFPI